MKKAILPAALLLGLLTACGDYAQRVEKFDPASNTDTLRSGTGITTANVPHNVPDALTRCYQYAHNQDTVQVKLTWTGDQLSGTMTFQLHEKDRNGGTVEGIVVGDTLILDYVYQAEGTTSTRQEILLKYGSGYKLATGPQEQQGNKMVFTDRSKIKAGTIVLASTACAD